MVKEIIKKTPLYIFYRNCKLKLTYAKNNNSFFEFFKYHVVAGNNLKKILQLAKTKNIGYGDFYYSLDTYLIIDWQKRYIRNIPVDYAYVIENCNKKPLPEIIDYVKKIDDSRISLKQPDSLKEALQSILFWNSLLWQTGHTLVGLGRLDKVLSQYQVTDNAECLIIDFLKTLHTQYGYKSSALKGDTGQIIILGGLEDDGSYFCNQYTYLFIKCLKKIQLPDPKILLRCSANMPEDLLIEAINCVSTGIGSPLFSNDDIVIPLLIDFGYDVKDAYNYGVSACWEPLSIGNSFEQNNLANIEYGKIIHETMLDDLFVTCTSFNDVLKLYYDKLHIHCNNICKYLDVMEWETDTLVSFMFGLSKDISRGGTKYNNFGILSVGMSAAVNSLLNIKRKVFQEKKYSLHDIQRIIANNYAGSTSEFAINENGFGIDNEEAINITNEIIAITESFFKYYRNKFGGKVKFGLSSPGYISTSYNVGATLDGRKAGEPFQTHISKNNNESITEIMNFESKLKFTGISSNANVIDVMIQSSLIRDNIDKFSICLMGGIKAGIFQMQMNVLSYAQLVDAKEHPEKYPNLIVRVWGFSAYFNDLPDEYKDNLIKRASEME